jgi:hypothetical protein
MSQRTDYKIQYPEQQGLTVLNDKGEWVTALTNANCWPVGSIFFAAVATNPNTLLGFGTWVLLGTGDLTLT